MLLRRAQVHGLAELTTVAEEPRPGPASPRWGPSLPFHVAGRAPSRPSGSGFRLVRRDRFRFTTVNVRYDAHVSTHV